MPNAAADIFRQAAQANLEDPRRRGNVVELEAGCDVIVTGDVHGNRQAFGRIVAYFERPSVRPRRLVLQELIHGPPDEATGQDRSVELLLRAARLKLSRPADVIFLLGNHDLAQITRMEIAKESHRSCRAFAEGLRFAFGQPTASRSSPPWRSFSAPCPWPPGAPTACGSRTRCPPRTGWRRRARRSSTRPYLYEDFLRGGPVYEWTWGRGQTDEQIDALAAPAWRGPFRPGSPAHPGRHRGRRAAGRHDRQRPQPRLPDRVRQRPAPRRADGRDVRHAAGRDPVTPGTSGP